MKLYIADREGVLHEVMDDLAEYDLTRPLAVSHVIGAIARTQAQLLPVDALIGGRS